MTFHAIPFDELPNVALYEILKSRAEVFFLEQGIVCQDMDGVDLHSLHCFLLENGRVCAYLRAFRAENDPETVTIGRVLTLRHGAGHGRLLMERAIEAIRDKLPCRRLFLHAQVPVVGFYERFGFRVISDVFLEENIPHVEMERILFPD